MGWREDFHQSNKPPVVQLIAVTLFLFIMQGSKWSATKLCVWWEIQEKEKNSTDESNSFSSKKFSAEDKDETHRDMWSKNKETNYWFEDFALN